LALYRARKALGLTQADVALAAGVGLRFVVELEAGKTTVRLNKVLQVIQALGARLQMQGVPLADDVADTDDA
jgi:y4mF family transcriptional regulator